MHARTTLQVDGVRHSLTIDTRTTLLDALRDGLGVMSPKKGCDHGQCGACTVLLDDPHSNPMGSRGIGEIGIVGAAAAIANAAWHATGVRVRELPIAADKFVM